MKNPPRSYNCKNEELPAICRNALVSLKRDQADFTAYSPRLNESYTTEFENKVNQAEELVSPISETAELKKITERIFKNMDDLLKSIDRLSGYVNLGKETIQLSSADFGISALRKGINVHDPEKVIAKLKDVNNNIIKYWDTLSEVGLTPEIQARFNEVYDSMIADRKLQYEILTNRKALVQNNNAFFNDLYSQLTDICSKGKILYKDVDPVKLQEYTFSELKKKVRLVAKKEESKIQKKGPQQNPDAEK